MSDNADVDAKPNDDAGKSAAPFRGVVLTTWEKEGYQEPQIPNVIDDLANHNVDTLVLIVTWYQSDRRDDTPRPTDRTPSNAALIHAAKLAKARGMRVVIKPHVDLLNDEWRGTIAMTNQAKWTTWFTAYAQMVNQYATLASEVDADLFIVGTELKQTVDRDEWLDVIATARTAFAGELTYAANWDNFGAVPFWSSLDYIGVDAYWPTATNASPMPSAVFAENARWLARIDTLADAQGKKALLTEFGYQDRDGTCRTPWWVADNAPSDPQEQALCYAGILSAVRETSHVVGAFSWMTYRQPQLNVDGFDILGKPAADTLSTQYGAWK